MDVFLAASMYIFSPLRRWSIPLVPRSHPLTGAVLIQDKSYLQNTSVLKKIFLGLVRPTTQWTSVDCSIELNFIPLTPAHVLGQKCFISLISLVLYRVPTPNAFGQDRQQSSQKHSWLVLIPPFRAPFGLFKQTEAFP